MAVKSFLPEVQKRREDKIIKQENILSYDEDNLYPQRMLNYIKSSGTASACVKVFSKFIRGGGFADPNFYKSRVNESGLTVDQLLRKVTNKYANLYGFCVHINYNALGQKVSANFVNFEEIRIGDGDDVGMFVWKRDWSSRKKEGKILYHPYNPSVEVIQQQIIDSGGIEKYKGQLYWYSYDHGEYPLAPIDPVVEDTITDYKSKRFRLRITSSGFLQNAMVEYPQEFESKEEEEEVKQLWIDFQGSENASQIIVVGNPDQSKGSIKISGLDIPNQDKTFELTTKTSKEGIIQIFSIPQCLVSVNSTSVFTKEQIIDGFDYYNAHTSDDRLIMEECFKEIFSNWHTPINPTGNYSLIPIRFESSTANI